MSSTEYFVLCTVKDSLKKYLRWTLTKENGTCSDDLEVASHVNYVVSNSASAKGRPFHICSYTYQMSDDRIALFFYYSQMT